MNNVVMMGRIASDIDLRVNGETAVAQFSLAVNRRTKDHGADFFRFKAFNKTAEVLNKYFHKGSRICISASASQPPKYTNKEGTTVYPNVEFIVNTIDFVDTKNENNQVAPESSGSAKTKPNDDFMSVPDGIEEELPFH